MDAWTLAPRKIAHVVGARPQFIKLKPLVAAVAEAGGQNWIAHTGQHFDSSMNDSFWQELGLRPDYSGVWSDRIADLNHLVAALREAQVDAVVVYGDTDSTLLGAKAALALGLPLAHAEAGLRSFNDAMPEEYNRVWVDQRANWLWAPTEGALRQLRKEGLDTGRPWVDMPGDLMLDAFPRRPYRPGEGRKVLVTLHRNTNIDNPERLQALEEALDGLASNYEVVWPRHPRHRAIGLSSTNVPDCQPMTRSALLEALHDAAWVITDSGGLQKEAFFAGRRCIVLRSETEWTELVESGWTALIDPDLPNLESLIRAQFAAWQDLGSPAVPKLYGDGRSAVRMAESLAAGLHILNQ